MRRLLTALLVLASVLLSGLASAQIPGVSRVQNPDKTFTPGADLETIQERGWIEFAVYDDFWPYSYLEGDTPRGIDIEIGRLIAGEMGVEARFRLVAAGETVDDDLRNWIWKGPLVGPERNVVNVMLHVPWDRELDQRNEQAALGGKYMVEQIAIAYRLDEYPDGGPLPAYFRFDTVGVENDSLADFYLSNLANGQLLQNIVRYRTAGEAMAALRAGEIKAVTGPLSQLQAGLDDTTAVHMPPLPGLARGKWTLGVAVRHNYRRLGYAVDDAIGAVIADGRLEAVLNDFSVTFHPPAR